MKQKIVKTLESLFPKGDTRQFEPYWEESFQFARISTNRQIAMFIAQTGHESAGYKRFVENLRYTADRLAVVWPNRFAVKIPVYDDSGKIVDYKTQPNAKAKMLAGRPIEIANFVYANKYENGPETSGDGWRFRGHGLIQLTFRRNYRRFTEDTFNILGRDFVKNPELLEHPKYALWAAAWYWKDKGLNMYADREDVKGATKVINGGTNGLKERTELFNSAMKILRKLV